MICRLLFLAPLVSVFVYSCSGEKKHVKSGRIVYSIEYPDHKDNFMLYSILPKEMKLDFKEGLMKCTIDKANFLNQVYVDCAGRKVSTYFEFGADNFYVNLTREDVEQMIAAQKIYKIAYTAETDTIAGFNVKRAVATAKDDPKDIVELWYTDEIDMKNSNWYNPFSEVPGFLLQYSIDRYGMRMDFRAKTFEGIKIEKSDLILKPKGNKKTYTDYNSEISGLFNAFE